MNKILFSALAFALLSGLAMAQDCGFDGTWGTDWGDMTLSQTGNSVTGTYEHEGGKITGTVSRGVLKGKWSESPSYAEPGDAGDIEFALSSDCKTFDGKWRYGSTGDWSGTWTGTRKTEIKRTGQSSSASGGGDGTSVDKGVDADLTVTAGDIDNLGFGWPTGFDVFSGQTTPSHGYPWTPEADDAPGTDVIMVGTGAKGNADGYSGSTSKPGNTPVAISMKYSLSGIQVNSAAIQMFVDDFQAPVFGSKFQVTLNDKRAPFIETVLNSLTQTGPVGKLVTMRVPDDFMGDISSGSIRIYIDDPSTGVGDGYAVDFVRILINPKESKYKGTVKGTVTAEGGGAIEGATISSAGTSETKTKSDGTYVLENVPAGLAVVTASKSGYLSSTQSADVTDKSIATLNYVLKKGTDPTLAGTATTTTLASAPTGPKDPTSGMCKGTTPYIYIEDRVMQSGKEVRIPVIICNAKDLANMDLSLNYDTKAMKFKYAEKGALNAKSLFESNEKPVGTIKISFAASQGVTGSGSIAILVYEVTGSSGQSSQITGTVNSASTSTGSSVPVAVNPGTLTVGTGVKGDCDGDGLVTSRDALAALQMAVEKTKTDMCYDVNGDGRVNSADARDILRRAAGGGK